MNKMLKKSYDPVHVRLTSKSRKNSAKLPAQKKQKSKKPKNLEPSLAEKDLELINQVESKAAPSNKNSQSKKNHKTKPHLKQADAS